MVKFYTTDLVVIVYILNAEGYSRSTKLLRFDAKLRKYYHYTWFNFHNIQMSNIYNVISAIVIFHILKWFFFNYPLSVIVHIFGSQNVLMRPKYLSCNQICTLFT